MAAILLRTTPFSQRAPPLAVVVGNFPETLHQTRDNTDFPRLMGQSEARLRLARPPSPDAAARRTRGVLVVRAPPPFWPLVRHGGGQRWRPRWPPFAPPCGEVAPSTEIPAGRPSSRPGGRRGDSEPGRPRNSRPQLAHWSRRHPEDRGLYPRCPTRGTSRLLAGRGFRAESIRSDSTIDASIHGQEGPPKSNSKRWV